MNCPHCDFEFRVFLANGRNIPDLAPAICEGCGEISLIESGQIRKVTPIEMDALRQSPAYRKFILPAQKVIREHIAKNTN